MNIFKKISLINRILKLVNEIKKHFNQNKITEEVKTKVENFINAFKDLKVIVPDCEKEIEEIIAIIKKYL